MNMREVCQECGNHMKLESAVGKKFPWRDYPSLTLMTNVTVMTCPHCGNMGMDGKDLKALDEGLSQSATKQVIAFLARIKEQTELSQERIAKLVGVTPQYLSKVLHGGQVPSYSLWNYLKAFASHPRVMAETLNAEYPIENLMTKCS